MTLAFIGENTEKWLLEYVEANGLDDIAIWAIIIYGLSLAAAGFIGWLVSGATRVTELQKTLAATDKIRGEVTTQKEAILNSIRTSRDELSEADQLVTEKLIDLRSRIEKGHNKKADDSREEVCNALTGPYWRALEDHCERIEYMLTGRLRNREISKTVEPAVMSICDKLSMLNSDNVMNTIGARSKLLLRQSTIHPIISTIKSTCPWWKPWTCRRVQDIKEKFKPYLRDQS